MCTHVCGSQRKTYGSRSCVLTSWVVGIELWLSGKAASLLSQPAQQLASLFPPFLGHMSLSLSRTDIPIYHPHSSLRTESRDSLTLCEDTVGSRLLLVTSHKSFPTSHSKPPLGLPYWLSEVGRNLGCHPCPVLRAPLSSSQHAVPHDSCHLVLCAIVPLRSNGFPSLTSPWLWKMPLKCPFHVPFLPLVVALLSLLMLMTPFLIHSGLFFTIFL